MSTRPPRHRRARTAAIALTLAPPVILSLGGCRRFGHGLPSGGGPPRGGGGGLPGGGVTFPTGGDTGGGTGDGTPATDPPATDPPTTTAPPTTTMPGMDHGGDDPAGGVGGGGAPAPSQPRQATGTFTGPVVRHAFGPVQVQVTVSDGRVTAVQVLQRPSGGYSDTVNDGALPKLQQQAVAANGGAINSVSGATLTSAAFRQSLESALNQARVAASA
jgi:uncharacterized protein with FMN-binding domain